ncbi:hypothetical protein OK016_22280 [Vibrio chagasii]|nr:hypothetical protein [Vibrio chagasii]
MSETTAILVTQVCINSLQRECYIGCLLVQTSLSAKNSVITYLIAPDENTLFRRRCRAFYAMSRATLIVKQARRECNIVVMAEVRFEPCFVSYAKWPTQCHDARSILYQSEGRFSQRFKE